MALSPENIIETICPELSGSPSLPVYLEMAVAATSRGFFGSLYNQPVAYLAAHLFTMFDSSGTSGVMGNIENLSGGARIASVTEDGLSVSFAQNSGGGTGTTDLDNTRYGKMLKELIKSRPTMGVNQAGGFR
jgi:hypothetical protein